MTDAVPPKRVDLVSLMEAAHEKAARRFAAGEVTTAQFEDALELLRRGAFFDALRRIHAGEEDAWTHVQNVADAVAVLFFVLNKLHRACSALDAVARIETPSELIGDAAHKHGPEEVAQMLKMSLPFLRAMGAVDVLQCFILDTRLANRDVLSPLLEGLHETACGFPARLFQHPNPRSGRPVDMLFGKLQRWAVAAVEARVRGLERAGVKGARKRAANAVATAFSGYQDARHRRRVTPAGVEQWHRDYVALLRGAAPASVCGRRLSEWEAERWATIARVLHQEDCADVIKPGRLQAYAERLEDSIRREIATHGTASAAAPSRGSKWGG